MTPQQVARVLAAAARQVHDPDLRAALTDAIVECENISREISVTMPVTLNTALALGFAPDPSVHDSVDPLDPKGARDADYYSTGGIPSDTIAKARYPQAEVQRSTGGQFVRVAVYFNTDTEAARDFTAWVNGGDWAAFNDWRNRQTRPQPVLEPRSLVTDQCATCGSDDPNAPNGKCPDFYHVTRPGTDWAAQPTKMFERVTGTPRLPDPLRYCPTCGSSDPADRNVNCPDFWHAVADDPTQRLSVVKDPAVSPELYHAFEPQDDTPVGRNFCKHSYQGGSVCDRSETADVHILKGSGQ